MVKKAIAAIPNGRLRREREKKGWSRQYVAEQIGTADPKTVGRWERGVTMPNIHMRQKLCTLFERSTEELGLFLELQDHHSIISLLPYQRDMLRAATISSLPVSDLLPSFLASTHLVGRECLLCQLKQQMRAGRGRAIGLYGLPGVGKTALALALAYDKDLQAIFHDGILWTSLGPQPDLLSLLQQWGAQLGIYAPHLEGGTDIEAWRQAVDRAIGERSMLLIIDNAWRIDDVLTFSLGGPSCASVITTRIPAVAVEFAGHEACAVDELSKEEGMTVLARFVPEVIEERPQEMLSLVQSVGGLPLALALMGKYLQVQTLSRQPRRLQATLARLEQIQERLRLAEPPLLLEYATHLPAGSPVSLQAVIEVSDLLLEEKVRQTLYAISVFPAKPNSFTEEAAVAVSGMPVETLDRLTDAGLLETVGVGRYALHQTIADYGRTKRNDMSAEQRLVAYMESYVERHQEDNTVLECENYNILAALEIALRRG